MTSAQPAVDAGGGGPVPSPEVLESALAVDPTAGRDRSLVLELVADSLDDASSDPAERSLRFAGACVELTMRVRDVGRRRRVELEVRPPVLGRVLLHEGDGGVVAAPPSPDSRWHDLVVPAGPLAVGLETSGGSLRTAWVRL